MNDSLVRRTPARAIDRFALGWTAFALVVAGVLFASGQDAAAAGLLVCPFLVGALALRMKRAVERRTTDVGPSTGGMKIACAVSAMPGVVLIVVGYLIGGAVIVFLGTALGASVVGTYALLIAVVHSLKAA